MKYQKGNVYVAIIGFAIVLAAIGGWIANIVKLTGSTFDPLTGLVVIRVIGVFVPPVGSIVGYI